MPRYTNRLGRSARPSWLAYRAGFCEQPLVEVPVLLAAAEVRLINLHRAVVQAAVSLGQVALYEMPNSRWRPMADPPALNGGSAGELPETAPVAKVS